MDKLIKFFYAYEKRFNDSLNGQPVDVEGTADAFAEFFVESSPVGVVGGKNDDSFKKRIPEGAEYYKSIGTTSMVIANLDISQLDEFHAMAKIHWKSAYDKAGKTVEIEFDVIYFVTLLHDDVKIFAYITGDEQKVLQENGLLPAEKAASN